MSTNTDIHCKKDIRDLEWAFYDPKRVELRKLIGACDFSDKKVLEIGSGIGIYALQLCDIAKQYIGIDTDVQMVRRSALSAKKLYMNNVSFERMDASELRFEDGTFDAVCCFWTINCLKEKTKVLEECRRVLKKGGSFILLDGTTRSFYYSLSHRLFPKVSKHMELRRKYEIPLRNVFGRSFRMLLFIQFDEQGIKQLRF